MTVAFMGDGSVMEFNKRKMENVCGVRASHASVGLALIRPAVCPAGEAADIEHGPDVACERRVRALKLSSRRRAHREKKYV